MKQFFVGFLSVFTALYCTEAIAEVRPKRCVPLSFEESLLPDELITLTKDRGFCPRNSRFSYFLKNVTTATPTSTIVNGFTLERIRRSHLRTKRVARGKKFEIPSSAAAAAIEGYRLSYLGRGGTPDKFVFSVAKLSPPEPSPHAGKCVNPSYHVSGDPGGFCNALDPNRVAYQIRPEELFCETQSEYAFVLESMNVASAQVWSAVFRIIPGNNLPICTGLEYQDLGRRFKISSETPQIHVGYTVLNGSVFNYTSIQIESTFAGFYADPTWYELPYARACTLAIECGLLPNGTSRLFSNGCDFADSGLPKCPVRMESPEGI